MATQLSFNYYRTKDKSEVDLIVEGDFGVIPIEVKLGSTIKRQSLYALENFMSDMKCNYAIVINRGKRIELLSERIIQIPVHFI